MPRSGLFASRLKPRASRHSVRQRRHRCWHPRSNAQSTALITARASRYSSADRRSGQHRRSRRRRGVSGAWCHIRLLLGRLRPPLDRRLRPGARRDRPLWRHYNNAFWNTVRWYSVTATANYSIASRSPLTSSGTSCRTASPKTNRSLVFIQAGALNESISDVFGSLIKQKVLPNCTPSRLVDWPGTVGRLRQWRGLAVHEGAWHRV